MVTSRFLNSLGRPLFEQRLEIFLKELIMKLVLTDLAIKLSFLRVLSKMTIFRETTAVNFILGKTEMSRKLSGFISFRDFDNKTQQISAVN